MVLSVLSLVNLLSKVQEQVVISPGTPSFSSVASHVQWLLSAFTVRSLLQTLVLSCLTTTLLLVSDFVSDAKVLSKQVDCFFFSCWLFFFKQKLSISLAKAQRLCGTMTSIRSLPIQSSLKWADMCWNSDPCPSILLHCYLACKVNAKWVVACLMVADSSQPGQCKERTISKDPLIFILNIKPTL